MLDLGYEQLAKIVYEKQHGISKDSVFSFKGYSLNVDEYLIAVSERGGARRILSLLKALPTTAGSMEMFLKGAISRIIEETITKNKNYYDYYKEKIRRVD
ncbi:hypothetical protein AM499_06750 [Bacillus sp. FJAT-22090]|uniref:hypothetical protein n=1 Tax=Bacillus sp. FJAT-22090 TaxID=1581038 RepID=UPI0006AEAD65|nr:hypothetical protein [Bacillus sp. FJAT-22090]ALC85551.1 hypothetical protein AM499_06750 [Bacillus sp. FJAT-22090]